MGAHERQAKAERALHDQTNILSGSQLILAFTALSVTLLINFIDQNGVSVALPTIATDLHAQNTISWAGTTSLIANTTFQMLYGRLSDIFGRKVVYLAAVGLLIVADLLCGLSHGAPMLYVFRGIAGIGGGGIANLTQIIVSDIVTLEQRGKYQGIIGAMVGVGNLTGPFLAAGFVQHGTWRGFFYTLAPLGFLACATAFWLLPSKPPVTKFREGLRKIDYAGVFASSTAVIFLLIPISGGGSYFPWDSPMVISFLAIGSFFLLLFIVIEWKVARLPMMPTQLFANPVIVVMLVQNFLYGAAYQSYLYYIPLYLQNARRHSAIVSAAIYSSLTIAQSVGSVSSGQYISRRKRYGEVIWFGFSIWTLGAGLTLLWKRSTNLGVVIVNLMIIGVGVGCIIQPTLIALVAHSPKSRRAVITSNRNFFRCSGGAVGLAISAAVLQAALKGNLPPKYKYLADQSYSFPSDLSDADKALVLDAYMAGSRAVFILSVPLIAICLLGCLFVRDRGLEHPEEAEKEANPSELAVMEGHQMAQEPSPGNGPGDRQHTKDT